MITMKKTLHRITRRTVRIAKILQRAAIRTQARKMPVKAKQKMTPRAQQTAIKKQQERGQRKLSFFLLFLIAVFSG
jgi:hypothetical protein